MPLIIKATVRTGVAALAARSESKTATAMDPSTAATAPKAAGAGVRWCAGPFVSFIHNNAGIFFEVRVTKALPEQHAIRHVLDQSLRRSAVFKADGISHS